MPLTQYYDELMAAEKEMNKETLLRVQQHRINQIARFQFDINRWKRQQELNDDHGLQVKIADAEQRLEEFSSL